MHVPNIQNNSYVTFLAAPVDGGYTNWSNWSACHVTCGTGVRNRSRNCTSPSPAFAGKNCSEIGEPWETAECVLTPCPGETSSWTSSNHSSSTPLSSTAIPSSSHPSGAKSSSSHFRITQSSIHSRVHTIFESNQCRTIFKTVFKSIPLSQFLQVVIVSHHLQVNPCHTVF
ncbi:hypothetical protein OS493_028576 [Desmophyllum pertusum]|uniref:Uncharacterized protein n=1 Tax=Desmophyllum pertusum TaxID=174260 RepID=A0A9X0CQX2_9CNID|nr:hypothetical protein OS493_028576 [Desmophyllum pertusum]